MIFTDFIFRWIYSLPVEQQGPTTLLIFVMCVELLLGLLQVHLVNQYAEYVENNYWRL